MGKESPPGYSRRVLPHFSDKLRAGGMESYQVIRAGKGPSMELGAQEQEIIPRPLPAKLTDGKEV